jgi:hypothetical protein
VGEAEGEPEAFGAGSSQDGESWQHGLHYCMVHS